VVVFPAERWSADMTLADFEALMPAVLRDPGLDAAAP
jgi:hypothetical protein